MGLTVHLYSAVTDARLLITILNNPAMPGNDNDNRFHSSVDNRTPRGSIKNHYRQEYKYLLSAYQDLGLAGVTTSNVRYNTPQTILSKFKTYFLLNILLRCCLCSSIFIWAKVRRGQRCSFSANLNLLYHLLFLILPHNCCIVMVVLYVGAIVLVVGGYI